MIEVFWKLDKSNLAEVREDEIKPERNIRHLNLS